MAGQWDTWLRELRATGKGPVSAAEGWPSATRGLKWQHPVELEGDWTGAALAGTVRSAPDAASALVTFTVSGPVVAVVGDETFSTFTVSLAAGTGANSTGVLPADGDITGEEQFPYMLLLTPSGGDQDLLFGGLFTVIGKA